MNWLARQLEDPARAKRIKRRSLLLLFAVVLAEVALPLVFPGAEHHFAFEGFPAFGSLYGLLSCIAIVLVSKLIGVAWLMKREDYYDH